MNLRIFFLRIRQKYFPRFAGKYDFNKILQAQGIAVGDHTIFFNPNTMRIDRERPWMLTIGDYCKLTSGLIILTHDYSRSVLRRSYGEIVGEAGKTIIGDNVFIGMNSIVLMGSKIGDNTIIGAGSVVSGSIPSNCVAAGNPCRVIRTLDEHYELRKQKTLLEAKEYYLEFKKKYYRCPTIREMGPFFWLFLERSENAINESGVNISLSGDDKDEVLKSFLESTALFKDFEDFKKFVEEDVKGL